MVIYSLKTDNYCSFTFFVNLLIVAKDADVFMIISHMLFVNRLYLAICVLLIFN